MVILRACEGDRFLLFSPILRQPNGRTFAAMIAARQILFIHTGYHVLCALTVSTMGGKHQML
jgi:hypothetical protein